MDSREMAGKHAFLCYARQDACAVDRLQAALEAAGVRVWRDTAELWPGEDWREKIRQAITSDALAFVACLSRAGLARNRSFQNEELALAVDEFRQRRPHVPWLIPVRLDNCEIPDLPLGHGQTLRSLQRADLFGARQAQETARLVTAITRILRPPAADPPGTWAEEGEPLQAAIEAQLDDRADTLAATDADDADATTEQHAPITQIQHDLAATQRASAHSIVQNVTASGAGSVAGGAIGGNVNYYNRGAPAARPDEPAGDTRTGGAQ